jgi:hypothetical protein
MYLEYQITEQEFKDFSYYTGWASPAKRQTRIRYYAINIIAYLALTFVLFYTSERTIRSSTVVIIVVILALLILYLRYQVRRRFERHVEKIIRESGEERILSPIRLDISETGISGRTNTGEANYKWAAIFKRTEANHCYYLYVDSQRGIVIPKRIFGSSKQKEEFDKLLMAYLPLQADLPI